MKSKTLINKQVKKKTNPELVKTILLAKKNSSWLEVANLLSGPRSKRRNVNLNKISESSKAGEIIVVPGKVLSQGEINALEGIPKGHDASKKMKIVALNFSEKAREKLLKADYDIKTILEEIKSNPSGKDIKILK